MVTSVLATVEPSGSQARPETMKELWDQYQLHLQATLPRQQAQQEIRLSQTALFRYTLPGWDGPIPLNERLSPLDIAASTKAAESVSLVQFQTALIVFERVVQQLEADCQQHPEPIKDWKKYFQGVRKRNKHYLNKIWDWANDQGWFEPPAAQKQQSKSYRFREKVEGKVPFGAVRLTQRKHAGERASTLAKPNRKHAQAGTFALGKVEGDVINSALQTQLDDLHAFMTDGRMGGEQLKEVSASNNLKGILQALGWVHRIEGIPLADLRLETLVPFVKLRISIEDLTSLDQWAIQSWFAREQAKRLADQIEANVRKYLNWRDSRIPGNPSLHPDSKLNSIKGWLVAAKYVYRNETDQDETDDFEDIPAVRRLRKLSRELVKQGKNVSNVVNHDLKMVSWSTLLSAVERLRVEAELARFESNGKQRSQTAQTKSMQRFLLLSFMSILPPDRQRTYRELRVGKTLVKGKLVGSMFTPVERMADPQNAKWYIHLEAPDYKTGETYGTWWGEVPDVNYGDEKTFYDYIDEWLHKWRQVLAPNHQYFFTQPNGKPLTDGSLKTIIKSTLYRLLHVPVTPHILRNMFITYLYEQKVPGHVLDSAALAMHHSRRMQAKSYNKQEQFDKLSPSFALALALVQQSIESKPLDLLVQTPASTLEAA